MLIDLSDVFLSEGKAAKIQAPLEMAGFQGRLGNFAIVEKSPVSFVFTNEGMGKVRIEGNVGLTFRTRCDRCLGEVLTRLDLSFDQTAVSAKDYEPEGEEEAPPYLEGYHLDVEAFVYDEVLMNWPMKILCRTDCKGICPKCGKNRNYGDCGCDVFVPDPRMAAIQDIFNASKEV